MTTTTLNNISLWKTNSYPRRRQPRLTNLLLWANADFDE